MANLLIVTDQASDWQQYFLQNKLSASPNTLMQTGKITSVAFKWSICVVIMIIWATATTAHWWQKLVGTALFRASWQLTTSTSHFCSLPVYWNSINCAKTPILFTVKSTSDARQSRGWISLLVACSSSSWCLLLNWKCTSTKVNGRLTELHHTHSKIWRSRARLLHRVSGNVLNKSMA